MIQKFRTLVVIALLAVTLSIHSCQPKGTVVIPVPEDTSALSKINHFIPMEQIRAYEQAFSVQRDTLLKLQPALSIPLSEAYNKAAIIEILKDPACVGIRVSYGIKQIGNNNEFRLILTGVDTQGNDLFITGTPSSESANENKALKAPQQIAIPGPQSSTRGAVEQGQCNPPCR